MSLTLHFHPLSSFCWKALIGLYELEVPFEKHLVDLSNDAARAAFARLWPIAKFPVLRDEARGRTVPESTILLEYVDGLGPRKAALDPDRPGARARVPAARSPLRRVHPCPDAEDRRRSAAPRGQARPVRRRTGAGADGDGVRARRRADAVEAGPWALGADFTLADCAAFPALFYGNKVAPFGPLEEPGGVSRAAGGARFGGARAGGGGAVLPYVPRIGGHRHVGLRSHHRRK